MSSGGPGILARTARGAGWVIGYRMVTRLLGLASTLILVRLMAPDEFGLVALAAAFAATLEVCLAPGVGDRIVRAKASTRELYDTAWTFNLVRGVVIGVLLLASAEPAARFFGEPRLTWVLWAPAAEAAGPAARLLALGIGLGVLTYLATVLSLWLAAGRPRGPETDVIELVRHFLAAAMPGRAHAPDPVRQGS